MPIDTTDRRWRGQYAGAQIPPLSPEDQASLDAALDDPKIDSPGSMFVVRARRGEITIRAMLAELSCSHALERSARDAHGMAWDEPKAIRRRRYREWLSETFARFGIIRDPEHQY